MEHVIAFGKLIPYSSISTQILWQRSVKTPFKTDIERVERLKRYLLCDADCCGFPLFVDCPTRLPVTPVTCFSVFPCFFLSSLLYFLCFKSTCVCVCLSVIYKKVWVMVLVLISRKIHAQHANTIPRNSPQKQYCVNIKSNAVGYHYLLRRFLGERWPI